MAKERHKTIPAVYIILEKDGEILLSRRYNTGYEDGNFSLPSGHVEANEHPREAIIRETREEIGVELKREDLQHAHTVYRLKTTDSERVDFFFTASKWEGEIRNMEPEKCDKLAWFKITELPENIVPYVVLAIEAWKKKDPYSED
jgi:mutator protein MutT